MNQLKLMEFHSLLKKRGIDFALFYNFEQDFNPHMLYFTGYKGTGVLVIPSSKPPFMLIPHMEFERAKLLRLKVFEFVKDKPLADCLLAIFKKMGVNHKRVGIDETLTSLYFFKKIRRKIKADYVDISDLVLELRAVKTNEEIALYKKACAVTDSIFQNCLASFRQFRTEKDVADFLEREALKYGCSLSFMPIVASGKRSSQPHFSPGPNPLLKGFCTIDFGIRFRNYCTDMTRTVYLGKPSKAEIDDYNLVLDVQTKVISSLKPGLSCAKAELSARKLLGTKARHFIHALGHGIGISIHEAPSFKDISKEKLKSNMIVAIEPGIYLIGKYGIRIEDDVLITAKGSVVLTKTVKDLITFNK